MSDPVANPLPGATATPAPESAHGRGAGLYLRTWLWLLGLTVLELLVAVLPITRGITVALLAALAVMKGTLIVSEFMHLRFERLTFVYAMLSPLILLVALLAGIFPDGFTRLP